MFAGPHSDCTASSVEPGGVWKHDSPSLTLWLGLCWRQRVVHFVWRHPAVAYSGHHTYCAALSVVPAGPHSDCTASSVVPGGLWSEWAIYPTLWLCVS